MALRDASPVRLPTLARAEVEGFHGRSVALEALCGLSVLACLAQRRLRLRGEVRARVRVRVTVTVRAGSRKRSWERAVAYLRGEVEQLREHIDLRVGAVSEAQPVAK